MWGSRKEIIVYKYFILILDFINLFGFDIDQINKVMEIFLSKVVF